VKGITDFLSQASSGYALSFRTSGQLEGECHSLFVQRDDKKIDCQSIFLRMMIEHRMTDLE
jgi:hypothetical protein